MTDVRKTSPWRRFIAVLAALVLVVLGIPTHDAPARAEENDAIKFDPVTLTHVTNTYTKDLGAFVISKILVSGGSEGTDTFGIEYKCSAAGVDDDGAVAATGTVAVTAGVDRVVGRFPAGTTCEVVSEVPSPRAGYALIVDKGQAVTVVKGDTVRVNVTNTYTKDSAPSPGPTGAPGPTSSTPPSASYTPSPSADPTVAIHPTAPGVPTPTGKEAGKPVVRPGLPRTGG